MKTPFNWHRRGGRHRLRPASLVLATSFVVGALGAVAFVPVSGLAGASGAVPYSDPASTGYIGLCNQQGQQITSGNINTAPFAWRAVSSVAAPAAYSGSSRTAILLAYQPIEGLAPSDWSGDELTASARYSNPSAPMAAATAVDESLAQYMLEYKPLWDGLLQLRIYLGAAGEQLHSVSYPTLDIRVSGDTWTALDGGQVNCKSGTAESLETALLPASQLKPQGSSSTTTSAPAGNQATGTGPSTQKAGGPSATTSTASHPSAAGLTGSGDTASSSSSNTWLGAVIGGAVVAALIGLFALLVPRLRRRRARSAGSSTPPTESDSKTLTTSSSKGSTL
jgi:hypothetical protein